MANSALRDAQRMASNYAEDFADQIERWQPDHISALECLDLQDRLFVVNGLLRLCFALKERFESLPQAEPLDYDPEPERLTEQMFGQLSGICRKIVAWIGEFEKQGYRVEEAEEFRSHRNGVEEYLAEAKRIARVEGRMGFRGVNMAPEALETFRSFLNSKTASPSSLPD